MVSDTQLTSGAQCTSSYQAHLLSGLWCCVSTGAAVGMVGRGKVSAHLWACDSACDNSSRSARAHVGMCGGIEHRTGVGTSGQQTLTW